MGAAFLVATAFGLAAAPAAGGEAGSGSPAPPEIQTQVEVPTQVANQPDATRSSAPTDAPGPAPLPIYRSPLDDYRPYRVDEPLLPWRDANDAVGRLGGHMGHLKPSPTGDER